MYLYIQKESTPRVISTDNFSVALSSMPFSVTAEYKDLPSHDWGDQHGLDVYRPSTPIFKAKTLDLDFVFIGASNSANRGLYSFFEYIAGGEFNIFDDFTGIGFRCAYKGIKEDGLYRKEEDVLEFTLTVDIDNPLSYGLSLAGITNFVALAECDLTVYWADGTSGIYAEGETVSKTVGSECEFVVVVPGNIGIITPIDYADSPTRLTDTGYLRILSSTGVRYVAI